MRVLSETGKLIIRAVMLDYNESGFLFVVVVVGRVRCMALLAAFLGMRWRYTLRSYAYIAICTGHIIGSARIRSVNY